MLLWLLFFLILLRLNVLYLESNKTLFFKDRNLLVSVLVTGIYQNDQLFLLYHLLMIPYIHLIVIHGFYEYYRHLNPPLTPQSKIGAFA